ncbi:hypothetical protein C6P45_005278 [Maudiozyma exigua]|uniref:protein-tyrosine-phosphatase n=1 Tax=Maudiozyma exigua TaxID=34358 RepID=A0A9P6WAR9_MAUEX|nr:hypothetical protein C6P45_005278 [Kazachstania exigua]
MNLDQSTNTPSPMFGDLTEDKNKLLNNDIHFLEGNNIESSSSNNTINSNNNSNMSSGRPGLYRRRTDISSIYSLSNPNSNSKLSIDKKIKAINIDSSINTSGLPMTFVPKRPNTLARNHSLSLSIKTKNLSPNDSKSIRHRSKTLATIKTPVSLTSSGNNYYSMTNDTSKWSRPGIPLSDNSSDDNDKNNMGINIPSPFQENLPVYHHTVYPNGPLKVISQNIFLYSEPTLEEILKFDVIINVAEEVEDLEDKIPINMKSSINYYHINWSHDSKIAKDLYDWTDLIHMASMNDKRVLVHCQCGVSRSASLIVAYIMRYDKLHLNDAYNKLKLIAKDVSPNMGLIFQLMEWDELLQNQS